MAIARIITRNPEEVVALSEELRARGYEVETLVPGDLRLTPAEIEIVAEKVDRAEAFKEARKRARRDDADLLISPNVLAGDGVSEAVERGNIFLDWFRNWREQRVERNAAKRAENEERKRLLSEESERRRVEREARLAEQRAIEEKRREQERLERERRRAEEAEERHARAVALQRQREEHAREEAEQRRVRELALQREREERARLEAEERERNRIAQAENVRRIAAERERIRVEQQREAEERQKQLAGLAQRHEEEERRRLAPTVIAIRQNEPAPEPVTTITSLNAEQEREDALLARFRRIAHDEVVREMAQHGSVAVPLHEEDDGGIRKWKGAFAGAAAIAVALAIALGFAVSRTPEPAQGASVAPNNGATVGPNTGVTLGPPTAPVKPNPPEAQKQAAPTPAPAAKPKARRSRRSSLNEDGIADDTVVVHHYAPLQSHVTTAKNGVKQISDDQ
jgi:hypothetical protein